MSVRYKLSPELADGCSSVIVDSKNDVLRAVSDWCDEFGNDEGECFSVETCEMSDEEVSALPEV